MLCVHDDCAVSSGDHAVCTGDHAVCTGDHAVCTCCLWHNR